MPVHAYVGSLLVVRSQTYVTMPYWVTAPGSGLRFESHRHVLLDIGEIVMVMGDNREQRAWRTDSLRCHTKHGVGWVHRSRLPDFRRVSV